MTKEDLNEIILQLNKVIDSRGSRLSKKDLEILITVREEIRAASNKSALGDILIKLTGKIFKAGLLTAGVEEAVRFLMEHKT